MTLLNKILFSDTTLSKFNSITKYPSILTYHNLGDRGSLVDSLVEDKRFDNKPVFVTEKIDGTNTRLILFTDASGKIEDYLIGSREDFLYACGDRIINPALNIVKNMKSVADLIEAFNYNKLKGNSIYCIYGETYGGKINNAKQYSCHGNTSIRIFDFFTITNESVENLLELSSNSLSNWREEGNQPFANIDELKEFCKTFHLTTVPFIETIDGNKIPSSLQDVWDWMQKFRMSNALIDDSGKGLSEGIVVRYADRSFIRKIRFEDYQRTKNIGRIV